jgi:hypothetical protein
MGSRPTQSVKSDTPWLDDDAIVRKLINDLEEPISFMFYLCNRAGLRTGGTAVLVCWPQLVRARVRVAAIGRGRYAGGMGTPARRDDLLEQIRALPLEDRD